MNEKTLVLIIVLVLFSCTSFTFAEEALEIKILDKGFEPEEITVEKGATVRWVNAAPGIHILAGKVRSPKLETGDSFGYVFEETGEYDIVDVVSKKRGKVFVTEAVEKVSEEEPAEETEELEELPEEAEELPEELEEEIEEEVEEEAEEKEAVVITVQETEMVSLKTTASDPDADQLNYAYSSPLDENGEWKTTYGDAGTYDVTVTVSDGELNISENVLLIVEKKEEVPTIDSFYPFEEELNIFEGDSVNFKITANDLNNDELSYTWELDGEKVSSSDKFNFFADYKSQGSYLVKVYVNDGTLTATKGWKMNIENFDRKPIFMPIQNILIKETKKLTIHLDATDPDGDNITYSAENLPYGSSLEGNVFSWFPGYDNVKRDSIVDEVLNKYHLVMDSYVVTFIAKGSEKESRQDVRITVRDVNRKPVLDSIPVIEITEGDSFTIKATASDVDGDKLKFSYSGWISQDSYTTRHGDAGEHVVKVTVSDGWLTDSQDVRVIVKKKNRAPVFKDIRGYDINEGELLKIKLVAYDADGDELVFSGENITNAVIKDNVFEWNVPYDTARKGTKEVKITFTVTDGTETLTKSAVVTVNDVNKKPEIVETSPADEITVKKKEPVIFSIEAADFDNDRLSYKWVFGLFEKYENYGNKMKRIFSTAGNKKIKVVVSDGEEEVSHEWNVKVT